MKRSVSGLPEPTLIIVTGLSLPRRQAFADAFLGPDEGNLVAQFVRHRRHRLVAPPGEEQFLNALRGVAEAHAHDVVLVDVEVLRAHAADVEADVLLDLVEGALHVVVDDHRHGGGDLEVLVADAHGVLVHVHHAVRREEHGNPAVADLRAHGDVLRPFRAQVHRNAFAHRVQDELQRLAEAGAALQRQLVVLAVEGHGAVSGDDLAEDRHPLAGAGEGLGIGLAVPAFHHLRPGHADAEDQAAVGEVVQGDGVHGGAGRGARGNLHDGRAEIDALGVGADPGERREAVRAVDFRRPNGVVAEVLRLARQFDNARAARRPERANPQSQLHGFPAKVCSNAR